MMQACIRMELGYDLTQKGAVGSDAEEFYWESMYKAMRRRLPSGPWRFRELRRHLATRPAFELRLSALFEPQPVRCVGEDGSVVYAALHFEHPPLLVKGKLRE
jgi:hypothetical protein